MSIASGYGPNWTTAESRGLDAQRRIAELEQQLAAAQAEARELRAELARVRELAAKWRAAPQNPDEPLLAMAADELEAALSKPAEQHDPLAVSDHCGECGEPEPECVCGEQPAEPAAPAPELLVIGVDLAAPGADRTVKAVIKQPPEHESLPLMARRSWMLKGAQYAYRDRDSAWFQSVDKPGRAWEFCYRIADTDEHGFKVIPRTADMPEDVTHMTLHTRRFFRAGELRARSVEGDEGLLRIEDYRPAAQESGREEADRG